MKYGGLWREQGSVARHKKSRIDLSIFTVMNTHAILNTLYYSLIKKDHTRGTTITETPHFGTECHYQILIRKVSPLKITVVQ